MHEPTQGALLRGVISALEGEVVPALEAGAAQRQLKAALVILRRLERAADREAAYLVGDSDDVAETLTRVLARADDAAAAELATRLAVAISAAPPATDLARARAQDSELQALAIDVEAYINERGDRDGVAELRGLHHRMLARQDHAWGTARSMS